MLTIDLNNGCECLVFIQALFLKCVFQIKYVESWESLNSCNQLSINFALVREGGIYCSWNKPTSVREQGRMHVFPLSRSLYLKEIHLTASDFIMLPVIHGERGRICFHITFALLIPFQSSHRKLSKNQAETFPRVIGFTRMSFNEEDSHQRKCSISSTQVSLSDGCLQRELGCSSVCGPNVKSTKDFSTAFHRHSGNAMWGHREVNIAPREC